MKNLLTLFVLVLHCLTALSQDLTLSIPGNDYRIEKDTLLVRKTNRNLLSFSVVYTVSGTNLPVNVTFVEGMNSTLHSNNTLSPQLSATAVSQTFSGLNYSNRIDFTLPTSTNYEENEFIDLVFTWQDMLDPGTNKTKRLTIKIHSREHYFHLSKDYTNTPKTEFLQFTDFLGINSDRPNGVLQQQFLYKIPIVKSYFKVDEKFKIQIFRSILLPDIHFNRIDKAKDDSSILVPLGKSLVYRANSSIPDTIANVVGSFDLIRYSNTIIQSSINIITLHIDSSRIYFNYDFGLLRDRIFDTISQDRPVSRPVYSYITGWHVYGKSILSPAISLNIEVEAGVQRVHLQDNFFQQYDIYLYENGNTKSIRFPIKTPRDKNKSRPIYHASVKLIKDWGKESTNYAFFRLKYQWQRGKYNFVYKDDPDLLQSQQFSNHFFQANLGVSLGLESLFKKN